MFLNIFLSLNSRVTVGTNIARAVRFLARTDTILRHWIGHLQPETSILLAPFLASFLVLSNLFRRPDIVIFVIFAQSETKKIINLFNELILIRK